MANHPYEDTHVNRVRKRALEMLENKSSLDDVLGYLYACAFGLKPRKFKDGVITFAADLYAASRNIINPAPAASWSNLHNYNDVEPVESDKKTKLF